MFLKKGDLSFYLKVQPCFFLESLRDVLHFLIGQVADPGGNRFVLKFFGFPSVPGPDHTFSWAVHSKGQAPHPARPLQLGEARS